MSFPAGILLVLIGSALMWVAMRGVETASPSGVFEAMVDGMSGGTSRTESSTNVDGDAAEERPNTGEEGLEGML